MARCFDEKVARLRNSAADQPWLERWNLVDDWVRGLVSSELDYGPRALRDGRVISAAARVGMAWLHFGRFQNDLPAYQTPYQTYGSGRTVSLIYTNHNLMSSSSQPGGIPRKNPGPTSLGG